MSMLDSVLPVVAITLIVPLAIARPQQSGGGGDGQAMDAAIGKEFSELDELIRQVSKDFGACRKFCAPDPGSVLAARLVVFRRRFGIDPRTTPQWHDLRDAADRALAAVGDRGHVESGAIQDVSSQMDRYVLLDILGQSPEAHQILTGVSTYGADDCIYCTAENSVVVNQRRSEEAERRGDVGGALRYLHDSALDVGVISYPKVGGLPGEDLLLARYGLLLEEAGHPDVGLLVLQDLVRTRAATVGGQLAHAELDRRNALGGVPQARFLSAEATAGSACRSCAVVAVWTADDPMSVRWIAARLPQRNDSEDTRTVAFDAAAFEEARPSLEAAIAKGSLDALVLMNGLPGGAERYVDGWLQAAKNAKKVYRSPGLIEADTALRWLHGDGPEHDVPLGRGDWHEFAEDWLAWRKDTGIRVRSAH